MDYFLIFLLVLLALMFVGGGLAVVHLLAPQRPGGVKAVPYECGETTIGSSWVQFNVGYYLFALLFLVFDVEAAFLFPWAVVFREVGIVGLIEAGIFILVLIVALIYAWRKGVLQWV
ncbi:NADH-quinone oxidoreductase subunit A [Bdellovibrionota bacterium]